MKWLWIVTAVLALLLIFTPSISIPLNESIYLKNNKVDYIGDAILTQDASFDNLNSVLDSIAPPSVDKKLYELYRRLSESANDSIYTLVGSKPRLLGVSKPTSADTAVSCVLQYYGDPKNNTCGFVNPLAYTADVTFDKGDILASYDDLGVTIRIKSNEVSDSGKSSSSLFRKWDKQSSSAGTIAVRRHKDITSPASPEIFHQQGHRVLISFESGSFSNTSKKQQVSKESGVPADSVSNNSLYARGELFETMGKTDCSLLFPCANDKGIKPYCYNGKDTNGFYALVVGNDSVGYRFFYNLPAKPKNRSVNGYSSGELIYKRKDTTAKSVAYVYISADGVSRLNAAPREIIGKYFGNDFTSLKDLIKTRSKDSDYNGVIAEIAQRSASVLNELG